MKEVIKFSLYQLIFYLVRFLPAKAKEKRLTLVKTDEIGDYLLIRNLLPFFKSAERFKDHKIILIGNKVFRPLFEHYDSNSVDEAIWLDKKQFRQNIFYRFAFLRKIRKTGASVAINLVYSRNFRTDDVIMAVSTAADRIGMENNSRLIPSFERRLTPGNIYTHLEDTGPEELFDALRNVAFVEKILRRSPLPASTAIEVTEDISSFALPPAYFVVFPGSGVKQKKWPASHFSTVTRHIVDRYHLTPVVCGSATDTTECAVFIEQYGDPVIDLSGKTSLPQLLAVLQQAACLISVDTGSVHLAAAVGCPVFALFNGAHYGRFAPYPNEIAAHFYPVYPDEIDEAIEKKLPVDFETIPLDLLRKIPPSKIITVIDTFFKPEIGSFKQEL